MIPGDDVLNARWVREQLEALDTTPRNRNWRHRALGMTMGEALATAPRESTLTLLIPVAEMRLLSDAAKRRELTPTRYVRRAVGTILHVCDGLPMDAMPWWIDTGPIGPR